MILDIINDLIIEINESDISTFYHYTNTEGLLGILDSNELWLTDSKFLNDPYEKTHGLNVIAIETNHGLINQYKNLIELMKNQTTNQIPINDDEFKFYELFYDEHNEFSEIINNHPTFIISFCENGDLLSQWKGYSNYGKGFSIGFNKEAFNKIPGTLFGKVIYSNKEKVSMVAKVIKHHIDYYKKITESNKKEVAGSFFYNMSLLSIFFKEGFFEEENEWRLVLHDMAAIEKIFFKSSDYGVTPFVKISINPIIDKIDKIIIGPKYDLKNVYSLSLKVPKEKIKQSNGVLQ